VHHPTAVRPFRAFRLNPQGIFRRGGSPASVLRVSETPITFRIFLMILATGSCSVQMFHKWRASEPDAAIADVDINEADRIWLLVPVGQHRKSKSLSNFNHDQSIQPTAVDFANDAFRRARPKILRRAAISQPLEAATTYQEYSRRNWAELRILSSKNQLFDLPALKRRRLPFDPPKPLPYIAGFAQAILDNPLLPT
jgi:hypothetical protein